MTIIRTYISQAELRRISQRDNDYLRRKLESKCLLNTILHKHINKKLLTELQCVLDNKPIVRRKTEQYRRNSSVRVFKEGRIVRVEDSKGKVIQVVTK